MNPFLWSVGDATTLRSDKHIMPSDKLFVEGVELTWYTGGTIITSPDVSSHLQPD